jgi:ATP-dependent DNA ligase
LTRIDLDRTHKYPPIAAAVSSLGARQAYLDAELCGVFPGGIISFSMIQAASDAGNAAGLVYFIFDLLHLDGEDSRRAAADRAQGELIVVAVGRRAAPVLQRLPPRPRPGVP